MTDSRPIRVLIAKPGLDGHDVGAKVIVQRLRNAGMEVSYTGLRQSTEKIISAAAVKGICLEVVRKKLVISSAAIYRGWHEHA